MKNYLMVCATVFLFLILSALKTTGIINIGWLLIIAIPLIILATIMLVEFIIGGGLAFRVARLYLKRAN